LKEIINLAGTDQDTVTHASRPLKLREFENIDVTFTIEAVYNQRRIQTNIYSPSAQYIESISISQYFNTASMSGMFGFGRPQPSSAEKIAAAEQEMDLVTDMFNKYIFPSSDGRSSLPLPSPA
jgi:hypothetical protein